MNSLNGKSILFLAGIFVSSLGSTAFVIALITFPAIAGVSAFTIGAIIGASRIVGVLTSFFAGPIGDYVSPRKVVYVGEFCALVCSVLLWKFSFSLSDSHFVPFLMVTCARSFFTSIQAGSTQKVGKLFDDHLKLDGRFAKYLNKATFGAIFFAMGLNLLILRFGSFQDVIIVDALTFLISGALVLIANSPNETVVANQAKSQLPNIGSMWVDNANYYRHHRALAQVDVLLAFIMMGANTLNVILLVNQPTLTPLASGIFGLAVWLATPVEKFLKPKRSLLWLLLGLSLLFQGLFIKIPAVVLALALVRNLSYWLIFNEISSEIMRTAKKEGYAGVASGRSVSINLVGALGEFWVGLRVLPALAEVGWRSCCAIIARILESRLTKVVVLVPATLSTFCSSSDATTLNLPIRGSVVNTDPQKMEDVVSLFVNRQIHRGLVRFTSELELVNDLVTKFEVVDDGRTYIFKLAHNTFSDGSKVTAQDVVQTFERMRSLDSAIVQDLHSIKEFSKASAKKKLGITALNDDTVKFNLEFADPFFIKNLAAVDCSILKLDQNLNRLPATSGRYTFKDLGDKVQLTLRDPTKWPLAPATVNLVKVTKDQQAIDLAKSGAIDSLESFEIAPEDQKRFQSLGWKKHETQLARVNFLSLNPRKLTVDIRHRVYSSIQTAGGNGLPDGHLATFGILPSFLAGSLGRKDIGDLLLGNNKVKSGTEVELSYPDSKETEGLAYWAKSLLERDGFIVKIKPFAFANYFKVVHGGEYQIMLRSKFLDYPDGMSVLTYFKSNLPINTFNTGDSVSDKLIERAQLENDIATRIDYYKKIQRHLLQQFTFVPLVSGSVQSFLCSIKIKSIKAHLLGFHSVYLNEIELNQKGT